MTTKEILRGQNNIRIAKQANTVNKYRSEMKGKQIIHHLRKAKEPDQKLIHLTERQNKHTYRMEKTYKSRT